MFLEKDIQQFKERNLSIEQAQKYLDAYKNGFAPMQLVAALGKDNGLRVFDKTEEKRLLEAYDTLTNDLDLLKFTPASGAASRMFKMLHNVLDICKTQANNLEQALMQEQGSDSFAYFWTHLKEFAFYADLAAALQKDNLNIDTLIQNKDYETIVSYLLLDKGLNYAALPKALIKFHNYAEQAPRTSIEEHLAEAAAYCKQHQTQTARLHFTVSKEHLEAVKSHLQSIQTVYEQQYGVRFEIDFSLQKPSTDIFAVNPDNSLFRLDNGSLLFRPGGHGALIANLDDLDADIIFVKNIDNVVPEKHQADTIKYKKILAAYLLEIQNKAHEYLEILEDGNPETDELEAIFAFVKNDLGIEAPSYPSSDSMEQIDWLFNTLHRPMRVCGMVRNEGEPGGGPFMVEDANGQRSYQIVESSQINLEDKAQAAIVENATHFNPVDIVCATKDYNGEAFNLTDFVDESTGFIAEKTYQGKAIKAQELPGLWNGAMAHWISLFVEVPISTFNPVKTVNDLLRPMHQG